MSKPVNKTLIGVFVIGAMALAVAAVLVFGSGKFFTPTKRFVMFFPGSVKGLNVGAPVIFRGVKVGEVTDIKLRFNPNDMTALIPVYIEIDPGKITFPEGQERLKQEVDKKYVFIQPLIDKGLKAQLQMQSFVTGQSMIYLAFYPKEPVRLVGLDKRYPEIPTMSTELEELSKTLADLKLGELFKKITHVVDGLDKIANSPELTGSIASLHGTLKDTDKMVKNVDSHIGPTINETKRTLAAATDALVSAKSVLEKADRALSMEDGVPARINETLNKANTALLQADRTLASFQTVAEDNSNTGDQLNRTLKELSEAARSIRVLADYLERHPESLLQGKPGSKGE